MFAIEEYEAYAEELTEQYLEEHDECSSNSEQEYSKTCNCGLTLTVYTQEDNHPEYYTTVKVKCFCGSLVSFKLPVN